MFPICPVPQASPTPIGSFRRLQEIIFARGNAAHQPMDMEQPSSARASVSSAGVRFAGAGGESLAERHDSMSRPQSAGGGLNPFQGVGANTLLGALGAMKAVNKFK